MKNILEIKNISKKIGKKQILRDITFEVKQGEIFGFVGPNGAGKTTLIKTMLGLYKQDSGSITINGFNIKTEFEKAMENIGAIIENPEMYDYLSGKDNLKIYKMIGNVSDEILEEIIKTVGLAQALISNPKLLILDEPTNGLDPIGIKELRELLKKISKEKNISVFVSSHILSEIELMCDRIAIIDGGSLIEIKDLKDKKQDVKDKVLFEVSDSKLASKYLNKQNYKNEISDNYIVLETKKEEIPNINKLLVSNNINVFEIKTVKKTLEDEFIEKTKGTKGQIK